MALSDAERAVLQARLAEAESALHELMIGGRGVSISSGGKSVAFTAADTGRLQTYINQLKRQLGIEVPLARPIRPIF